MTTEVSRNLRRAVAAEAKYPSERFEVNNDIISSKIPVDAKHVMIDPDWNQTKLIFKLMFEEEL